MDYNLLDLLGFAPFDATRNAPVKLPGGDFATEYSATSKLPDGSWIVHPQIWWDADGNPRWLGDQALDMTLLYEANTGKVMPRFQTEEEANTYAATRSRAGGGTKSGIAALPRE